MGKKKLTLSEANKLIQEKLPYLTVLEYNGREKEATFLDTDFGEFKGKFISVLENKKNHPLRAERKRYYSIEKLNNQLQERYPFLSIKDYQGYNSPNSIFLDIEFGEFKSSYKKVYAAGIMHRERALKNLKENTDYSSRSKKAKQTNFRKYGVENVSQIQGIQQKIKQKNLIRYGVESPSQLESVKNKLKLTKMKNGNQRSFEGISSSELAKLKGVRPVLINKIAREQGEHAALNFNSINSYIEEIISIFLKSYNIEAISRNQLKGTKLRPDFIIPSYNLIIECDGDAWHCDRVVKGRVLENQGDKKKRRQIFLEKGYTPLFFRGTEIINKSPIVQSIILNKLNLSTRIFARKTIIKEVSKHDTKIFLYQNHLMGYGTGKAYGLYYQNQLICLIQIRKKKDGLEISRFCTKLNTSVIGGYSKLLNFIKKTYNPYFIESFVDLRYGTGEGLRKLGFKKETEYLSFTWTNFKETVHRMTFPGNTGYQAGYYKLWDCGQAKYVIKY